MLGARPEYVPFSGRREPPPGYRYRARIVTVIFVVVGSVALATTTQEAGWSSGSFTAFVIGVRPIAFPVPRPFLVPLRHWIE